MADAIPSAERQAVENAAEASWIAFLLPIVVRMALRTEQRSLGEGARWMALASIGVTVACIAIGIGAGAYALAKVRRVGPDRVLWPALTGIALNLIVLVVERS